MKLPITGHCLCGAVKYDILERPKRTGLCYCNSCQRKSGGNHIAYLAINPDAIKIIGEIKWYQTIGDSGQPKQHGFCPNCGTNLFAKSALWSNIFIVYAGSLDHSNDYSPEINIWLEEAPSWACINQNLPGFKKNPK